VSVRAVFSTACVTLAVIAAFAGSAFAGVAGFGAAKSFHKFPVYWAGSKVAGIPLESINHGPRGFTFFYGSCELRGTDHPSCAPPMQIQVDSTCDRWADELNRPQDLVPLRGAKAHWHPGIPLEGGGEDEGGPLEIFTGRETITIFVEPYELKHGYGLNDPEKVAFEAADALRTVHQSGPKPMAPPVPGSLEGKLACQKPPVE
jgi:hypothetical protein